MIRTTLFYWFFILFYKGVYPNEYMDNWKKFNGTLLPEKEDFYSQINMEDISDADYALAKRVCKYFEMKNLGEYHDLHVQRDALFLADRTLEICVLKYTNLILQYFFQLLD